jgi:hypothetical protein
MSEADLNTLEHDVEQARARFAADLARVRSPTTFAHFKDDLLAQARDTKDGLLHDLKERAIANPIATLAIGAGVAWRLVRHPPIATLLIGFGVVSLLRTSPHAEKPHEAAGRHLADATSRAKELADSARQKVEQWSQEAAERVRESVEGIAQKASTTTERAGAILDDARKATGETVSQIGARASELTQRASEAMRDAAPDPGTRDKLLLGAATLAVTAAVGMAYQRRAQERLKEAA